MKRMICSLLSLLILTAAAEEIQTVDAPLIHTDEMPLAVDISPVIRFETDEAGVFAVVTVEPLASSEELDAIPASADVVVEEEQPPARSHPIPSHTH